MTEGDEMDLFNKDIPVVSPKNIALSGLTLELFCRYINRVYKVNSKSILIVTSSLFEANQIVSSLSNYQDEVHLFPMDDFLTSEAIAISPDLLITRLETINAILEDKKMIVVANIMGYLRYLPDVSVYKNSILNLYRIMCKLGGDKGNKKTVF